MKKIKKISDLLFEDAPTGKPMFGRPTTVPPATNPQRKADPPAAQTGPVKLTDAEFTAKIQELDGFALYFSNIVKTVAKYDSASMEDCDGWFDDNEQCYWKVVRRNYDMLGAPAVHTKFTAAVAAFAKLIQDDLVPNKDIANLVLTRANHNLHEANRINFDKFGEYKLASAPAGGRTDTLRGMVFKKINMDDHYFRWSMYYYYSEVKPYGGSTAEPVNAIVNYNVDCDF